MLVGGGVEDDRGCKVGEDLFHAHGIGNISDGGDHFDGGPGFFEFALDFEDGVLGLVDEHEQCGFKAADRAA